MKRLILGSLSILFASALAAPAAFGQAFERVPSEGTPFSPEDYTDELQPGFGQPTQTPGGQQVSPGLQQPSPGMQQQQPGMMTPGMQQPGMMTPGMQGRSFQGMMPEITPFQLVNLARHGYLAEQGIPTFRNLAERVGDRRVTERDVVEAGVNAGYLSVERMDDAGYQFLVQRQLWALGSEQNANR